MRAIEGVMSMLDRIRGATSSSRVAKDEIGRIYTYPNGETIELRDTVYLRVKESGYHMVKTSDNLLSCVKPGWEYITILTEAGDRRI